jgi:AraC family transcriptional regulator, regulatory protein of adaptative response / methylated-DNA-[protein]-cysteine methyltransferase
MEKHYNHKRKCDMDLMMETRTYRSEEERWQAFSTRDRAADGHFFIGVKTTGIFCRVMCPARLPKRENILFFDTWQEAEAAGFRACKRCHPKEENGAQAHIQAVIDACQVLEQAETAPTLESLALTAGLSPFHFQRVFKKLIGISPKQYYMEKRSQRLRENLPGAGRVTDAIYDAGFNSSARFYSQAGETLGMSASTFRKGGRGMEISYTVQPSALGLMLVAATEAGVCLICFGDDPSELEKEVQRRFPHARVVESEPSFGDWVGRVASYVKNPGGSLDLPLDIQGTAFQRRVWAALREIPAGETETYSQVAARIGNPKAVRAVANACADNNLAVAIPCHRVVRTDGGLGGYRWGLKRKRALLEQEKLLAEDVVI